MKTLFAVVVTLSLWLCIWIAGFQLLQISETNDKSEFRAARAAEGATNEESLSKMYSVSSCFAYCFVGSLISTSLLLFRICIRTFNSQLPRVVERSAK